jgi:hypothetical protein
VSFIRLDEQRGLHCLDHGCIAQMCLRFATAPLCQHQRHGIGGQDALRPLQGSGQQRGIPCPHLRLLQLGPGLAARPARVWLAIWPPSYTHSVL